MRPVSIIVGALLVSSCASGPEICRLGGYDGFRIFIPSEEQKAEYLKEAGSEMKGRLAGHSVEWLRSKTEVLACYQGSEGYCSQEIHLFVPEGDGWVPADQDTAQCD